MTAQILAFPTTAKVKPRRENKRTVAKRLIPQILGLLMTKGEKGENGLSRFVGNGLAIYAASPGYGVVTFATVEFQGASVFRFGIYANGETYVTKQVRGNWEAAVSELRVPDILPIDLVKHWIA